MSCTTGLSDCCKAYTDRKWAGSKGAGNKGTGSKGTGNKGTDSKGTGNKGTGSKGAGSKGAGSKRAGSKMRTMCLLIIQQAFRQHILFECPLYKLIVVIMAAAHSLSLCRDLYNAAPLEYLAVGTEHDTPFCNSVPIQIQPVIMVSIVVMDHAKSHYYPKKCLGLEPPDNSCSQSPTH